MYSFKYSQRYATYTVFFIIVNALHVSGGFSAHHQELKTVHSIWYVPCLPNRQRKYINISTSKENCIKQTQQSDTIKHAPATGHVPDDVCKVFELLMMGDKPPETCRVLTIIKNIVGCT
jgi:hypothetical protein